MKKKFLEWYLLTVGFQSDGEEALVRHLIDHPYNIERVHFVLDGNENTLPLVEIASPLYSFRKFRYQKFGQEVKGALNVIADLEADPDYEIYIKFEFPNREVNFRYSDAIKETNSKEEATETELTLKEYESLRFFYIQSPLESRKQTILNEIDRALDAKDHKVFLELHSELTEINQKIKEAHYIYEQTRNPRLT